MKPFVRLPLIYGIIAGLLGLAFSVLLYYLNQHPVLIPPHLDSRIFLFAVFMFLLLRELREVYFGGILYFWQGLLIGFLFLTVFGMVSAIGIGLFGALQPDFVSRFVELRTEQFKSFPAEDIERIGKDLFERNLKSLPSTNAFDLGLTYLGQSFMIGFFLNIIVSVISRRTPKN